MNIKNITKDDILNITLKVINNRYLKQLFSFTMSGLGGFLLFKDVKYWIAFGKVLY